MKKKKKGGKQQRKNQSSKDTDESSKQQHPKQGQQLVTPRQTLVQNLITLFELVPNVLPPSMDFSFWVKDTLTFGHRQNIPEYGAEILDNFEIEIVEPIALTRSGTETSRRSTRSEVSHSPEKTQKKKVVANRCSPSRQIAERRAKRQQAYFASLLEEKDGKASTSINADDSLESATITGSISTVTSTSRGSKRSHGPDIEKDDAVLLKTSVSLTAAVKPKSQNNPFLKGSARGTYVGSHLSSKLSNISTLFREVTIPAKKQKQTTTTILANNNARTALPTMSRETVGGAEPKAPFNITAKVSKEQHIDSDSEKSKIRATPRKRLKVDGGTHLRRAGTYPPLSTPTRVIEETPAKPRGVNSTYGVISETPQQPRFRRQQLDLSINNATTRRRRESIARNHHHHQTSNNTSLSPLIQYGGLSPLPQKKNVVAEAAKAAARKRK